MNIQLENEELHGVKATDFSCGCCWFNFEFQGSQVSIYLNKYEIEIIIKAAQDAVKRLE